MRCAKLRLTHKTTMRDVHRVTAHSDAKTWCKENYTGNVEATILVAPVTCRPCLDLCRSASQMKTAY